MARPRKRPELTHAKVTNSSHPKAPWRVSYAAEVDGKPVRLRKAFAGEEAAWQFAEEKDREVRNHGLRYGDIPPEVRRAFDFYRDEVLALSALGITPPRFETLVTDGLAGIRQAHADAAKSALPVAEAVALYKAYKQTRVQDRQFANVSDRLKRFAEDFGDRPIPSITSQEIDRWLSSLRSRRDSVRNPEPALLSPQTRNAYRAILNGLFKYAAAPARGWCERNPVSDLEPEHVKTGEPEAYTVPQVSTIMATALESKPDLVPVLALGFFSGLRVSEAADTELAKLGSGTEFRTDGKTGPRQAPLTPAGKAWLAAQPRREGKAWTKPRWTLHDEVRELFELAKVEQIHNGARHSFISYRCAETRNIAAVADECGNSVGTIKAHYRNLVTAAEAKKYFAIRPAKAAANVTSIEAGRASA